MGEWECAGQNDKMRDKTSEFESVSNPASWLRSASHPSSPPPLLPSSPSQAELLIRIAYLSSPWKSFFFPDQSPPDSM